ncbi:MAG: hypothetical protein IT449_09330 [Phycisphaerales bacterium]|nr:hypothetical protein [Phycisphaerales bacterium]
MTAVHAPLPILEEPASRLRRMLDQRPLYIIIEATHVCNARCGFGADPKRKRAKGIMSAELFAKVIRDYDDMGGGAVSLTPRVGDVPLDPPLMQRLDVRSAAPLITDIRFVTNGIGWRRGSAPRRERLAHAGGTVHFGIGGGKHAVRSFPKRECRLLLRHAGFLTIPRRLAGILGHPQKSGTKAASPETAGAPQGNGRGPTRADP